MRRNDWWSWLYHLFGSAYGWTPAQVDELEMPLVWDLLDWLSRHPPVNVVVGDYLEAKHVAFERQKQAQIAAAEQKMAGHVEVVKKYSDKDKVGRKMVGVMVKKTGKMIFGKVPGIGGQDGQHS